jgi:Helitron helicase-like domain at N-terminus
LCLTHAEKMLIQKVSPFIPLHHIKNGTFGLSGHVCAFEQDINGICTVLPRLPADTTVIRIVQELKTEVGDATSMKSKTFHVRRRNVLDALHFLKLHNKEYQDITVDASRLDWLVDGEGELDAHCLIIENLNTNRDDTNQNADMGCSNTQCIAPRLRADDVQCFGYINEGGRGFLSEENNVINEELQASIRQMNDPNQVLMDWPALNSVAVSEYDNTHIFAGAFPWLFPGGYGDIKDHENAEKVIAEWGQRLLYYEDARFAKDKLFCFFAMNYIVRHRNSSSGKFFIENFQRDVPDTLDELKETIKNGDTRFVNNLTYWNKRIKGSSPYWHQKKSEVYSWINHHVEMGHGPPTYFITLSCAEYFWPDVIDLLKNRLQIAGLKEDECHLGSPKLIQLVNDYTIVIQEYFQKRTEIWLKTVGREVFDIEYYWVRYEFAPGRGQIHAHLLAIPNNHDIYRLCHIDLNEENGDKKRAERLANWCETKFGLTACVAEDFDSLCMGCNGNPQGEYQNCCKCSPEQCIEIVPPAIRFCELEDDEATRNTDAQRLMKYCQEHQCSKYCMRQGNENR